MKTVWDMESGEFDSCWCADDGCADDAAFAGWDPAVVEMQENAALQVAGETVARARRRMPPTLSEADIEAFLQRMYAFQG